jgi:hypothetical protein
MAAQAASMQPWFTLQNFWRQQQQLHRPRRPEHCAPAFKPALAVDVLNLRLQVCSALGCRKIDYKRHGAA